MFPARISNEIGYKYYTFLVGQINRGTSSKKVCRSSHRGYETYHLTSVM